ncbi:MAG: T9SS type A sorting domain-containing protein [Acidobacteriota bacterium]
MRSALRIAACLITLIAAAEAQQPAFPGAEGYGKFALGGRGGRVIEVTNLLDDAVNPPVGSLRYAIKQSGPRTVVFRVSGTITLAAELKITNPYITIAGQTAPGDGICLKKYKFTVAASHAVIRYIRARLGNETGGESDAMGGDRTGRSNIIIDHCSVSWSEDEALSPYCNDSLTVQWCIISESLYNSNHPKGAHGYGGIWGGNRNTYHHNLIAHHSSRNPRFASGAGLNDFRNNVVYNWGFNSTYGGEMKAQGTDSLKYSYFNVNMVANYYKPGPATKSGVRSRICNPSSRSGAWDAGKWYVADNVVEGSPAVTADNWNGGVNPDASITIAMVKADSAFDTMPIPTEPAERAFQSVLASAGASKPARDAVDRRIVNDVKTGTAAFEGPSYRKAQNFPASAPVTGIIDSQNDVGGWPVLSSLTAPDDADHDGMPDSWERAHGLDPNNATDGSAVGADGYTRLEDYLNALAGGAATSVRGEAQNAPAVFELRQNYPNPFNPSTTFEFAVPETGYARLAITDIIGREAAVLFDGRAEARAVMKAVFHAAAFPSGIYIARLTHQGTSLSRKILLMK